ncbi:helix-turn-helix domain-containing protein [Flagellimonas algicola]|uniref:Helix-turn-helix transcriptional regulator n=1 Tax=Flagellimonas algicola TaxID=2583815 RepID=A0ABY2WJW4_9FLAO|nr:AraC family transcriptional regulator [Allomuricauda algicola]TMU55133.1 helix-turn-helix transcriptional regulator [Allomuricauda algicola]
MSNIVRIRSINEVHKFLGIEKPKHPLVSVIEIDDSITNFDYGDTKYVFDFYQINLKQGFSGSMNYGRNSYDFDEGTLTFIKPNQTIQVENQEEIKGSSGWTLLFHPDLIRKSELGKTIEDYSFFNYDLNEALHLSEKERKSITELVLKIKEEYNQNIDKHSQELIVGNIEMLLKYSKRFYDRQFYTRTNLNKDILTEFNRSLKNYYNSEEPLLNGVLTVKECSNQLNLSVNYLGDLIKSETGKSAKEHIQEYVIERAKTKLLGSSEDVSQIAYSLGYEYPQGFNKLFKSKVGLSPSQYRNLN